jgi:hypothetical protein
VIGTTSMPPTSSMRETGAEPAGADSSTSTRLSCRRFEQQKSSASLVDRGLVKPIAGPSGP